MNMTPSAIEASFRPMFNSMLNAHFTEVQRSDDVKTSHSALGENFTEGSIVCKKCLELERAEKALKANWDDMKVTDEKPSAEIISFPAGVAHA